MDDNRVLMSSYCKPSENNFFKVQLNWQVNEKAMKSSYEEDKIREKE